MKQFNFPEPEIPVDEAWNEMKKLLDNTSEKTQPNCSAKKYNPTPFFNYGIGLLILSIIIFFVFRQVQSQKQEKTVNYFSNNTPTKNILQNGSVVFLNKFSSVSVATKNKNDYIISIKGAVFFDKNSTTENSLTKINIGSLVIFPQNASFFISFDTALNIASIHVQSGTIKIKNENNESMLYSGESLNYNEKNKAIDIKKYINVNLFSFVNRIFEFSNTPLSEAIALIESAYGVSFKIENDKLNNCRITTKFDNKSLKEVLDIISYTLYFDYNFDEKNNLVTISGNGCKE